MMNLIKNEMKKQENFSMTENGAVGYKSSGSALVDINYQVSSLRNASEEEIELLFDNAFYENKELALANLLYLLDIRNGRGERRIFKTIYKNLCLPFMYTFPFHLHIITHFFIFRYNIFHLLIDLM